MGCQEIFAMKTVFELDSQSYLVDVVPGRSGQIYRVTLENQTLEVEILRSGGNRLDLLVDGKRISAYLSSDNARRWVTIDGRTFVLTRVAGKGKGRAGHQHAAGELTAPMPGQVRAVNVSEGDKVSKGQTLLLLEAMKMEIRIQSPQNGVVEKLFVKQGQTVEREQMLIEIVDSLES